MHSGVLTLAKRPRDTDTKAIDQRLANTKAGGHWSVARAKS